MDIQVYCYIFLQVFFGTNHQSGALRAVFGWCKHANSEHCKLFSLFNLTIPKQPLNLNRGKEKEAGFFQTFIWIIPTQYGLFRHLELTCSFVFFNMLKLIIETDILQMLKHIWKWRGGAP